MSINRPDYIFIHCTDSNWATAADVVRWHTDPAPQGRGWPHVGYHYLILNGRFRASRPDESRDANYEVTQDGLIERLLPEGTPGIHAPPFNRRSLAVCLVGKTKFTGRQRVALLGLVAGLRRRYNIPIQNVLGHCESPAELAKGTSGKTCPNLDMLMFRVELEAGASAWKLDW